MKKNPVAFLVLALIICSLFMPLSINYAGQNKLLSYNKLSRYITLSKLDNIENQKLIYYNKSKVGFYFKSELGIEEGIKNGIVVMGNYFRNIIIGTIVDYLNGFKTIQSNIKIVWLFFGIFFEIAKNMLFSTLELIAIILILLLQAPNSYIYVLSYVLTILFIVGIAYFLKKNKK